MTDTTPEIQPTVLKPVSRPRPFKTGRTIVALMMREMQTTYGRSPGGYIWAILEPVGAIAMFTFVISVGLKIRIPSLGSNFPLFYATGFLPFSLAMSTSNKVASSLKYSRSLLQYPGVQYTDALLARFLLNVLTHVMVFFIIMSGIHFIFHLSTIRNVEAIGMSLGLAGFLGLGIGTLNCFLFSISPLWTSAWGILTRPLLLISCVLYIFEEVPWQYQHIVAYNPLVHINGLMRRGFYATYDARYASPLYVLAFGLVCLVLGLVLLHRYHRYILNR
ncbi:ABC transporter permease [Tropicimonas isoalkanivorans]|uniref:Transport permease protein n=1 Tax=Tropicimonas isoalkanivorans TaxID=441112 RepID=A0A1I1L4U0_9RHOB|nr:ABC transporter permease [Tropicimonas isoalkanivorans]SFC65413.1 capsular polysaccharide transport system permease protein [Tropicimonas isoalkanivorans]